MTVHCPHCATAYLLPDALLGPRGARVRCPRCANRFVVLREATAGRRKTKTGNGAGPDAASVMIAREVMTALSTRLGPRLATARAAGRVLAVFGPELMTAFDEYRKRAGVESSPHAFRTELRDRWGIDLVTGDDR